MSITFDDSQDRVVHSYADAVQFRHAIEPLIPSLQENGKYVIPRGDAFWIFYHAHARLFVFKEGGDWGIEAKPLYDPDVRKREERQEHLEKWKPSLKGCYVGFLQMQILERLQRNGVRNYTRFCPGCEWTKTSALQFALVEHLLTDIGLHLVTKQAEVTL